MGWSEWKDFGGGEGVKTANGVAYIPVNTAVEIDTGLSEIESIVVQRDITSTSGVTGKAFMNYQKTRSEETYSYTNGSSFFGALPLATAISGNPPKLGKPNGGKITIYGGSSTSYNNMDYYWYVVGK